MNPYTSRKMIDKAEYFFGRKKELNKLFPLICNSQSCSIIGERRIGKSSLLNAIRLPEIRKQYEQFDFSKHIFVYFDFASRSESSSSILLHSILKEFSYIVPDIVPDPADTEIDYEGFESAIADINNNGYKIALLCDEFDVVAKNKKLNLDFFFFLRSIANKYKISYITASQEKLSDLCHSDEIKSSPFFNIFVNISLGLFDKDEAVSLIEIPMRNRNIDVSQDEVNFVLDLAGYHPFFIQIACYYLFSVKEQKKNLTEKDFEQIKNDFLIEAESHFEHIVSRLDRYEKNLILSILQGEMLPQESKNAIKELIRKGVLIDDGNRLQLFSKSFTRYIRNQLGLKSAPENVEQGKFIITLENKSKITGDIKNKEITINNVKVPFSKIRRLVRTSKGTGTNLKLMDFVIIMDSETELKGKLKDNKIEVITSFTGTVKVQTTDIVEIIAV